MAGKAGRRGNHEGNIRRRADGRWEARITLAGGRVKSFYGKTRQEVVQRLTRAQHERQQGLLIALDERQTVAQYLASWLATIEPTVKPRTWQRYEQAVRVHVEPALGTQRLVRLSAQHVQAFYVALLAEGLSPATVRHLHVILHHALDHAVRLTIIPRNVCGLVTPPRAGRQEMHILTPEQAQCLLEAARGHRLEALYVLGLTTGARLGELLGLRWHDVDLDAHDGPCLHISTTLYYSAGGVWHLGPPKTAQSSRRVDLAPLAVEALRRHRARQLEEGLHLGEAWSDHGFVFTRGDGEPVHGTWLLDGDFRPLLARAGLPRIRFHDLCHTAATLLLLANVPAKVVSELLGHSNVGITLGKYSHVLPTMQRDAAAAMERMLSSAR
jgi:integrase